MPAEPPDLAIKVSRLSWFGVSHFTKAKELKLKMKQRHEAHSAAGARSGIQRCLTLPNPVLPAGRNLICSSQVLSIVAIVGSRNLITSDRLNHTCAAIRAMKCPGLDHPVSAANFPIIPVSRRKSIPTESNSPPGSINIKKPIATTIDGVTNGMDNNALSRRILRHL